MWSPRQLGELADTSRRTVRHYHELGLLPDPERSGNGYTQYGVAHLIRLLRIRRMTQLGLTLPQIAALDHGTDHPAEALRELDATLAAQVELLQRTRTELAQMLERGAPTDLPIEAAAPARRLPPPDRSLLVVLSRLLDRPALQAYLDILPQYHEHPAVAAFDQLGPEVDEDSRRAIATGIAEHLGQLFAASPNALRQVDADLAGAGSAKRRTIRLAIGSLYSPVQLDVLERAVRLTGASPPRFRR